MFGNINWSNVISALAFLLSAVSIGLTYNRKRKDSYINRITLNRLDWNRRTKKYISEFIMLSKIDKLEYIKHNFEIDIYLHKIIELRNNLLLHFSTSNEYDITITKIIMEIMWRIEILLDIYYIEYLCSENERNEFILKYNESLLENGLAKENTFICTYESLSKIFINEIYDYQCKIIQVIQKYLNFEWKKIKKESNGKIRFNDNSDIKTINLSYYKPIARLAEYLNMQQGNQ